MIDASVNRLISLVDQARDGDADALGGILNELLPELRAYVRVHAGAAMRARESGSDLVQSICREVLEDIGSFRGTRDAQFRKWLFTLALNKILAKHRFHRAQRRDVAAEVVADESLCGAYGSMMTPSRVVAAREQVVRIERAMDVLPEEYRRVITLACLVGLSYAEIAADLDRSETAVRKLLSRARARLALLLAGTP